MNKIFKVIWNHTTQTFVVTSELSKAKGKSSSSTDERSLPTRNLLNLGTAALVLGTTLGSLDANAAYSAGGGSATGMQSISIGTGATLYGSNPVASALNSTAIGYGALAGDEDAIAIGSISKSTGNDALAIGTNARALQLSSTAIGVNSTANGSLSAAYGQGATAGAGFASALGSGASALALNASALGSLALAEGNDSTAVGAMTSAVGVKSAALGYGAEALAGNTIAIGNIANATGAGSIALGSQSRTEKDNSVAIGLQSKSLSADAIAVGRQAVANATSAMALGWQANSSGVSSIAIGESANVAKTGVSAIALGTRANADKQGAVSIGLKSNATAEQAIAIGELSKATANDAVAIGSTTNASQRDTIAIGTNNDVSACYSVAIGSYNKVAQAETYVLGNNIISTQANSVILGSLSKDRAATTETSATINDVTYGNFAGQGRSGNGVVSIGAEGSERQLINVAAGKVSDTSTDAINGSQLYAVANKLSEGWAIGNGAKVGDVKTNNQVNFLAGNANTNVEVKANGTNAFDVVISALNTAAGIEYYSVNSTVAENKDNKGATASNAMAAGPKASATGNESTALGYNSTASAQNTVALGSDSIANATSALAVGVGATATADSAVAIGNDSNATGQSSVAIGESSNATGAYATAVGDTSTATGNRSVAFGIDSKAGNTSTVAIGDKANATGVASVAMGLSTKANGTSSIAIGSSAESKQQNGVAIGNDALTDGHQTTAVGALAKASGTEASAFGFGANASQASAVALGVLTKASSFNSVAVGRLANASADSAISVGLDSKASGTRSVSLGADANSTLANSVALGSGTTTTAPTNTNSATVNGITYSGFAGANAYSVVSVGNDNQKRQIQNVAAGRITATSTDAINGSQLYFSLEKAQHHYYSVNDANVHRNNYDNTGATGEDALAAGVNAAATAKGATAAGNNVTASGAFSMALGNNARSETTSSIALGNGAKNIYKPNDPDAEKNQLGSNSIAIGLNAATSEFRTIAIGEEAEASGNVATALGYKAKAKGIGSLALGDQVSAENSYTTALGVFTKASSVYDTAIGANAIANGSNGGHAIAIGYQSNATNFATISQGSFSKASGRQSVSLGYGSSSTEHNSMALGQNATSTHANSVALGSFSETSSAKTDSSAGLTQVDSATVNGITYNGFAGANPSSVVSVGKVGQERRIQNVAAGLISATSTDAINGSQLYVVANNLTDAINVANNTANTANATVNRGWNITTSKSAGEAKDISVSNVKMGDTVTIDAGKNINITQKGATISIATSDKPTFTTATVGNTSLNGDDIKLGNTTIDGNGLTINNGPSITNKGIDAANKPITNVANGTNGTDAVNLNQLNEVKAASTTTVKSDDKSVTVKEDLTNGRVYDLSIAQADVVTNPNGTTTNNKAGNTFVTGDNLVKVLNNTSFNVTSGKVGSGTVSGTTAEQVKAGETVTFKAGNNLVLAQDGQNFTYSLSNTLDLTDKGSIKLGNTTITDNNVTVGNVSVTDKGINAANNTISNVKDGEVSATSKDAVNGSQLYTTNQNVTNVTNTVNKGWNITTSASNGSVDGTSLTNVKMGDTVTIDAGKNINITQANGKISIATSDKPTFTNVTVGDTKINNDGVTINNGPSITNKGIDAANTTISNVKDGKVEAGSKEAVNGGQLFNATTNLTNAGLNFVGNNVSGVIHKNLSQTLAIVGELANTAAASAKNVRVDTDNGKLVIKLSENPTFTTVTTGNTTLNDKGLTIKDGPSITNKGIDAGNKVISNVAAGIKPTDAVNVEQLTDNITNVTNNINNVSNEVAKGWNITTSASDGSVTGNTTEQINMGELVTIDAGKNINITQANGKISIATSDKPTFSNVTVGDTKINNDGVTINNGPSMTKNGIDAANTTISNVKDGKVEAGSKEAVNGGQLFNATTNLTNAGLNFVGNNANDVIHKNLSDTLAIVGELAADAVASAKNIRVDTEDGKLVIKISENPTFSSVTTGNTTLNDQGLTIKDGPSITNKGIDAGNKVISNVAAGTKPTDAVNVSQLDAKTAAAKTELANGNTTTVTPKKGDNGQTIYTVEVNKAPVTINSTTGVAETLAAGDKANNSFATVGDVVNALNNVSWAIQGNGVEKDKVTAGNQVNFVNGSGTTADVTSNGTKTDVTFNVNKSGLTVNKDGNGNVTVTADTTGDTFATADDVAKAITDSELTSTVVAGNKNLNVTSSTKGNNTEFNVTLSNNLDLTDKGSLTIGNVTVKADGINAGDNKVTGVADGDISPASTQAVNGSQLYAANQNIANYLGGNSTVDDKGNVTAPTYTVTKTDGSTATANNVGEAISNLNNEVVKPLTFAGDTGAASERKLGSTVMVKGGVTDEAKLADNNIGVVSDGNGTLTVKLAKDLNVDSVTANTVKAGDTTIDSDGVKITNGPSVTKSGIDAAGNKITNVKAGEADTDAVNVSQLKAATGNVHNRINKVNKQLRAGIAGANAAAGLPQVYIPGKSMVAAAAGTFKGESALAVGYSRSSDNGKVILKLQGNANTRGDLGGSVGVGYQW
ncbi:YadA-like family protein [Actinobacillus equuli]|uniref:YadA-like family protein n=1 Tax=Actinobacillus equuli TaxID=718 RepID=UPI0024182C19|nr:YadA-like family protein [Actinobacillus equuli]MDG4952377.1 YadA-like family protein [Actinobacillus equuli subsp. equuli]